MSYTLGNKKWTFSFMSQKGRSCRVDIYKRGYTGTDVTVLDSTNSNAPALPAADPIYYEEDDDEDLLSVVRAKTGYINLVETVYGSLDELFPTKNTDHYIEFYYGGSLNFMGFIQAQSFENSWKAAPREVSIPIVSPLGMLDSITMPVYNPPQAISLAALLDDVLDKLAEIGIEYDGVIWPQLTTGLDATISSLVVSPFNSEKTPASSSLWEPISCNEFVEGLCNAFGWMIHEMGRQIILSKYDHTGNYNYILASNLRTLTNVQTVPYTGGTEFTLTDYVTPADNNGNESTVMPAKKVVLEYGGEYVKRAQFEFGHMVYNGTTIDGNQYAAWLTLPSAPSLERTPEISAGDYARYLLPNNTFNNGKLISEGVNAGTFGNRAEQKECLLVNLPQQGVTIGWIFSIKFYERPTGSDLTIKWKSRWGDNLLTLSDDNTIPHKDVQVKIKAGDLWYQGGGQWSSSVPSVFFDSGGLITNAPAHIPIEVRFYEKTQAAVDHRAQTLTIEDLTLEEMPTSYSNYTVIQSDNDTIKNTNGDGECEVSVNMLFSGYRKNSNMIGSTVISPRFTDYDYMLKSNKRLQIKFKKTGAMTIQTWAYFVYSVFMSEDWRIISMSEYPWNDEVIITMQRVLNN